MKKKNYKVIHELFPLKLKKKFKFRSQVTTHWPHSCLTPLRPHSLAKLAFLDRRVFLLAIRISISQYFSSRYKHRSHPKNYRPSERKKFLRQSYINLTKFQIMMMPIYLARHQTTKSRFSVIDPRLLYHYRR